MSPEVSLPLMTEETIDAVESPESNGAARVAEYHNYVTQNADVLIESARMPGVRMPFGLMMNMCAAEVTPENVDKFFAEAAVTLASAQLEQIEETEEAEEPEAEEVEQAENKNQNTEKAEKKDKAPEKKADVEEEVETLAPQMQQTEQYEAKTVETFQKVVGKERNTPEVAKHEALAAKAEHSADKTIGANYYEATETFVIPKRETVAPVLETARTVEPVITRPEIIVTEIDPSEIVDIEPIITDSIELVEAPQPADEVEIELSSAENEPQEVTISAIEAVQETTAITGDLAVDAISEEAPEEVAEIEMEEPELEDLYFDPDAQEIIEQASEVQADADDIESLLQNYIQDAEKEPEEAELPELSVPIEQFEATVEEMTEKIETLEPDKVEVVHQIMDEIIEVPAKLEISEEGELIGEAEVREELEELFVALFMELEIPFTTEIIKSFVDLAIYEYANVEAAEEAEPLDIEQRSHIFGTHELINRLLQNISRLKKATLQAGFIGKSAVRLYHLQYAYN